MDESDQILEQDDDERTSGDASRPARGTADATAKEAAYEHLAKWRYTVHQRNSDGTFRAADPFSDGRLRCAMVETVNGRLRSYTDIGSKDHPSFSIVRRSMWHAMLAAVYNAEELDRYAHEQRLKGQETKPRNRRSDANTSSDEVPIPEAFSDSVEQITVSEKGDGASSESIASGFS